MTKRFTLGPGNFGLRLLSGEEIITEVVDVDNEYVYIKSPIRIQFTKNGQGEVVGVPIPWTIMSKEGELIPLNKSLILAVLTLDENVVQTYNSATTGIALPEKKSIVIPGAK